MAELSPETSDDALGAWTARHLGTVIGVMARAVRDPVLAFDLATELLAAAALQWDRRRGEESRLAWVLGFAPALLDRAVAAGSVPTDERMRNRSHLGPCKLGERDLAWLSALSDAPLELDPEARRIAARIEREAPTPARLRRLASSPLVTLEGIRERS